VWQPLNRRGGSSSTSTSTKSGTQASLAHGVPARSAAPTVLAGAVCQAVGAGRHPGRLTDLAGKFRAAPTKPWTVEQIAKKAAMNAHSSPPLHRNDRYPRAGVSAARQRGKMPAGSGAALHRVGRLACRLRQRDDDARLRSRAADSNHWSRRNRSAVEHRPTQRVSHGRSERLVIDFLLVRACCPALRNGDAATLRPAASRKCDEAGFANLSVRIVGENALGSSQR